MSTTTDEVWRCCGRRFINAAVSAFLLGVFSCVGAKEPGALAASIADSAVVVDVAMGAAMPAMINDQGPFRFGLDTGQSMPAMIDPKLAQRLSLPVIQQIGAEDGSGHNVTTVDVVRIDDLQVGDLTVSGAAALAMPQARSDLDGTLGFPFFADHLLLLDYPAGRIRVHAGELTSADGQTILDFELRRGLPVVEIDFGGTKQAAVVDSAMPQAIELPLGLADSLPLTHPPQPAGRMATLFNEFDILRARLAGVVRFGNHKVEGMDLTFSDHFSEVILGREFLQRFRLTFDQRSGRLLVE